MKPTSRSLRHALILASLAAAAAFAACTLNPQPLPPNGDATNAAAGGPDAAQTADAGGFGEQDPETPAPLSDAGANADNDAADGGDAGDASDATITDAADSG